MAKPPKAFDVWFVTANTVYKAVPYNVVANWTEESRLAPSDRIRPTGAGSAWLTVAEHELLSDYIPRPTAAKAMKAVTVPAATGAAGWEPLEEAATATVPVELPEPEPIPYQRPFEEDDDVDMIPLIDVSMVLLVFFIIIRATGALAPVDVPEMKYAGQLSNDPDAITINVDKKDAEHVFYSIRIGTTAPKPEHDQLPTPEAAIAALDELINEEVRSGKPPPPVRIACHKELPGERVYELRRELEPRFKKGYIASFTATVIEAPKKE